MTSSGYVARAKGVGTSPPANRSPNARLSARTIASRSALSGSASPGATSCCVHNRVWNVTRGDTGVPGSSSNAEIGGVSRYWRNWLSPALPPAASGQPMVCSTRHVLAPLRQPKFKPNGASFTA